MIYCKECLEYVNLLFKRGEIEKDEIEKIMMDRHILKNCIKKIDPFADWLEFAIEKQKNAQLQHKGVYQFPQWNEGYLEALLDVKNYYIKNIFGNEKLLYEC